MTPPRLTEVECPECHKTKWIIDSDYWEADLDGSIDLGYAERSYSCAGCGRVGPGWLVRQQSPPEFWLQPHDMYPMTHADFDHWVAILRANFPDHPRLAELGKSFFPRTPEEVACARAAWEQAHPVGLMRDQDGARREDPDIRDATDWLEVMKTGDSLSFLRRDGGVLQVRGSEGEAFSVRCSDAGGQLVVEAADLDSRTVRNAIGRYLAGDLTGCTREVHPAGHGVLARLWDHIVGQ